MKNKRLLFAIGASVISVILCVIGLFILPDRVTVNISFQDEQSYMSKYIALAFPLVVSLFSSKLYFSYGKLFGKEVKEDDYKIGIKYLVFSALGIFLTLWVVLKNI
ncbi:MAG: hypothetical protein E7614_02655 [Ruminococcaceae bacterium]|nr:hypothetical protein [Oscillospiraceae bacterium]